VDNLKTILENKRFLKPQVGKRPINQRWETAKEFGDYVGLATPIVLRLFRLYGESKVLNLRTWLYDIPYDSRKGGKLALAIWKLKGGIVPILPVDIGAK
jgi:hypothetical protein